MCSPEFVEENQVFELNDSENYNDEIGDPLMSNDESVSVRPCYKKLNVSFFHLIVAL